LFDRLPDLFRIAVLSHLEPDDCTVLAQVAKPWLAVVVSHGLPRAGRKGQVKLKLQDFLGQGGPGRYSSHPPSMPYMSRNEGSQCVG
jgi:hypothetical protein